MTEIAFVVAGHILVLEVEVGCPSVHGSPHAVVATQKCSELEPDRGGLVFSVWHWLMVARAFGGCGPALGSGLRAGRPGSRNWCAAPAEPARSRYTLMPRLPAVRSLADSIRSTARGRQTVGDAADYLAAHRADLALFDDPEHLALSTDSEYALPGTSAQVIRTAQSLSHQIVTLRSAIGRELWARQIFIDPQVLEELVFYVAREGHGAEPVVGVLEWIRDARATRPGLMIFPLHSLGVLGAGLLRPSSGRISFINPDRGYAVTPQTNGLDRTLEFLDDARSTFGIGQGLPRDLIRHWHRSRSAEWLERNPLLVLRTIHVPGSYYGSEWLLVSRIQATTGMLAMLAALQPASTDRSPRLFSSRSMNNWQTLDIHHYLILFAGIGRTRDLDGQCIPIHASRTFVSELSDLAIEIDPLHWRRRDRLARDVHDAVEFVYAEYLRSRFHQGPRDARQRTVTKLFESMGYFRRSFQGSSTSWSGSVALATAFEMLLLDSTGGIRNALVRRSKLLLKGTPGTKAMQAAVGDLYAARNALVHAGDDDGEADIARAREAYVRCFVEITHRLPALNRQTATPLGDLIGDA